MSESPASSRRISKLEELVFGARTADLHRLIPGLAAAVAVMLVAEWLAGTAGRFLMALQGIEGKSPISAVSMAIVLGIVVRNLAGTHPSLRPGLDFSVKKILRLGIILVGIRIALLDIVQFGAVGIPVVIGIIAIALVITPWLAARLGVGRRLGLLTAAGTSICGVTATVTVAPVIGADENEVAYTVANVTLFGVLAMLIYPYLAHALFAAVPPSSGLFLGTAIHDTSQVMGAALSYSQLWHDETAFKVATVTKLTRNLFLIVVVPLLGFLHARGERREGERRPAIGSLVPLFVVGFVAMGVVRTVGDAMIASGDDAFGLWGAETWSGVASMIGEQWAGAALAIAMAGVGLSIDLALFRRLGLRPLWLGASAAIIVGAVGLLLAALLGPLLL